jgi:hypothetical protein
MRIRPINRKNQYIAAAAILFLIALSVSLYMLSRSPEPPKSQGAAAAERPLADDSEAPQPAPAGMLPGDILNLSDWKLTLPVNTNHAGNPDEITQPELGKLTLDPYFRVNDTEDGLIFRAPVGGATTKSSGYPRSELREMSASGRQEASWSSAKGTHTLTVRQAITHLPAVKPHVVAGQIHDASDDVVMIRLEGSRLFVEAKGKEAGTLDAHYALGTVFTVKIVAAAGHIKVSYNDVLKVDYATARSGLYFKAGCYTQSNTQKGDAPAAYGEVIIYSLDVAHQ